MITGGGQLHGCIIARTLKMNGHAAVHYDESLRNKGRSRGLVITSWDEL